MANDKKKSPAKETEQARQKKEEKSRAARRRNRQIIGIALSILIVVGAVSIINGGITLVGSLLDGEDEKSAYQSRFEPMVWFDILPFESISTVDENSIKQVCVWGALTKLGDTVARNEYGEPLVPVAEVDLYGITLFGPDFRFTVHESFSDPVFDLRYTYDATTQTYAAPATGLMPPYLATVVDVQREAGGVRRVVMGYISTRTADDQVIAVPDYEHPAKYRDFMLRRDGNDYYLYAILSNTTHTPTAGSAASTVQSVPEDFSLPESLPPQTPSTLPQESSSTEQDSLPPEEEPAGEEGGSSTSGSE